MRACESTRSGARSSAHAHDSARVSHTGMSSRSRLSTTLPTRVAATLFSSTDTFTPVNSARVGQATQRPLTRTGDTPPDAPGEAPVHSPLYRLPVVNRPSQCGTNSGVEGSGSPVSVRARPQGRSPRHSAAPPLGHCGPPDVPWNPWENYFGPPHHTHLHTHKFCTTATHYSH